MSHKNYGPPEGEHEKPPTRTDPGTPIAASRIAAFQRRVFTTQYKMKPRYDPSAEKVAKS
jgi:hypothetical protein